MDMTKAGRFFPVPRNSVGRYIRKLARDLFRLPRSSSELNHALAPVFLISSERSGSHFLWTLLNSVKGVHLLGEVLNPGNRAGLRSVRQSAGSIRRHVQHCLSLCSGEIPGVKIVLYQLTQLGLSAGELKDWFPDAKFIILYRESLAEQFLSLQMAVRTGVWDSYHENRTTRRLTLDPAELAEYVQVTEAEYRKLLSCARVRRNAVIVKYEDLVDGAQSVFDNKLFAFLALPRCQVRAATVKVLQAPHRELISNWADVCDLFRYPRGRISMELLTNGRHEPAAEESL